MLAIGAIYAHLVTFFVFLKYNKNKALCAFLRIISYLQNNTSLPNQKTCIKLVFKYNKPMNKINWSKKAIKQLRKVDRAMAIRITKAVDGLVDFSALKSVKALNNHQYDYRLKVGQYRVLFNNDDSVNIVLIEEVKKRNERTY